MADQPTQTSQMEQQQDPRGDRPEERPAGDIDPGARVPPYDSPYQGRTTGPHETEDVAAGNDTGGLGQAAGQDIDDLDMAHHKGKPEKAKPELVPNEGTAKYPEH